jgi:hypothetical protein
LKFSQLKAEVKQSARNLYGEKSYPLTSDWIPVADVLAIVDRFERQLHEQLKSITESTKSQAHSHDKELVQRILTDLLS